MIRKRKTPNKQQHSKFKFKQEVIDKLRREGKEVNLINYFKAQLTPQQLLETDKIVRDGKVEEDKENRVSRLPTRAERKNKLRKMVFS